MVEIEAIMHDEMSNLQITFKAVIVLSSYKRKYIARRLSNYF